MRKTAWITAAMILLGVVAAPASSAGKKCKEFVPVEPQTTSSQRAEALDAEVVVVTEEATAESPITVDYSLSPAVDDRSVLPQPIMEDETYFNLQVVTKAPTGILTIRAEWTAPVNDIDLTMFDDEGFEVMQSVSYNPGTLPGEEDGPGYEVIAGWSAPRCSGYTVESRGATSVGGPAVMKFWLE